MAFNNNKKSLMMSLVVTKKGLRGSALMNCEFRYPTPLHKTAFPLFNRGSQCMVLNSHTVKHHLFTKHDTLASKTHGKNWSSNPKWSLVLYLQYMFYICLDCPSRTEALNEEVSIENYIENNSKAVRKKRKEHLILT